MGWETFGKNGYIFVGSIRLPLASKSASSNLTVVNLWTGLRFRCSGVDEEAGGSEAMIQAQSERFNALRARRIQVKYKIAHSY